MRRRVDEWAEWRRRCQPDSTDGEFEAEVKRTFLGHLPLEPLHLAFKRVDLLGGVDREVAEVADEDVESGEACRVIDLPLRDAVLPEGVLGV